MTYEYEAPIASEVTNLLRDSSTMVAVMEELALTFESEPVVVMNFAVTAGNFPATFDISSAVLPTRCHSEL